jgi:predicted DNA-binding ribbon-helix-helix protein
VTAHLPQSQITSGSDLYGQDFYLWIQTTAELLKQGRLTELDLENLIEEIETMGRSEKGALESNLEVLLMHLLKYQLQTERRSKSWQYTILEQRRRVQKALKESPSLKPYFEQVFDESYQTARRLAVIETGLDIAIFPEKSFFTPEQALDPDFLPES